MADLTHCEEHGMETVFTPILNMHGVLCDPDDDVQSF